MDDIMEIEITHQGKAVKKLTALPKKFKSGKEGFYANGTCVVGENAYRVNILMYKVA